MNHEPSFDRLIAEGLEASRGDRMEEALALFAQARAAAAVLLTMPQLAAAVVATIWTEALAPEASVAGPNVGAVYAPDMVKRVFPP